jgi:Asp-tRNA(Asn)/Glu-tRNA(Gln) amidotransferase A subunit family amidase
MLQAIAHYDSHDFYSQKFPPVYYPSALEEKCSTLRLGRPAEFWKELDGEVEAAAGAALAELGRLTAGVEEMELALAGDRTLVRCEPFVYHQRHLPAHAQQYHPDTLRRIMSGADVTAMQYVEAHRDLLRRRREVLEVFEHVDLIVTPTMPVLAPSFAELEAAPEQLRTTELLMLRNTRPFNVYGLPTVSIPCGFSKSGLPVGLQISGTPGSECAVLALASAYEKLSGWQKRTPPVTE